MHESWMVVKSFLRFQTKNFLKQVGQSDDDLENQILLGASSPSSSEFSPPTQATSSREVVQSISEGKEVRKEQIRKREVAQ